MVRFPFCCFFRFTYTWIWIWIANVFHCCKINGKQFQRQNSTQFFDSSCFWSIWTFVVHISLVPISVNSFPFFSHSSSCFDSKMQLLYDMNWFIYYTSSCVLEFIRFSMPSLDDSFSFDTLFKWFCNVFVYQISDMNASPSMLFKVFRINSSNRVNYWNGQYLNYWRVFEEGK